MKGTDWMVAYIHIILLSEGVALVLRAYKQKDARYSAAKGPKGSRIASPRIPLLILHPFALISKSRMSCFKFSISLACVDLLFPCCSTNPIQRSSVWSVAVHS